jgi:hypothetical protein
LGFPFPLVSTIYYRRYREYLTSLEAKHAAKEKLLVDTLKKYAEKLTAVSKKNKEAKLALAAATTAAMAETSDALVKVQAERQAVVKAESVAKAELAKLTTEKALLAAELDVARAEIKEARANQKAAEEEAAKRAGQDMTSVVVPVPGKDDGSKGGGRGDDNSSRSDQETGELEGRKEREREGSVVSGSEQAHDAQVGAANVVEADAGVGVDVDASMGGDASMDVDRSGEAKDADAALRTGDAGIDAADAVAVADGNSTAEIDIVGAGAGDGDGDGDGGADAGADADADVDADADADSSGEDDETGTKDGEEDNDESGDERLNDSRSSRASVGLELEISALQAQIEELTINNAAANQSSTGDSVELQLTIQTLTSELEIQVGDVTVPCRSALLHYPHCKAQHRNTNTLFCCAWRCPSPPRVHLLVCLDRRCARAPCSSESVQRVRLKGCDVRVQRVRGKSAGKGCEERVRGKGAKSGRKQCKERMQRVRGKSVRKECEKGCKECEEGCEKMG